MAVKIDRGKGERHASPIPKEMKSMKVRMLVTHDGSPDGININEYQAGQKYDLPERLARIFLDAGWAEEDKVETIEVKNESKTNPSPRTRTRKPRRGKKSSKG